MSRRERKWMETMLSLDRVAESKRLALAAHTASKALVSAVESGDRLAVLVAERDLWKAAHDLEAHQREEAERILREVLPEWSRKRAGAWKGNQKAHPPRPDRNRKVLRLHDAGVSCREMERDHGIKRETASRILKANGRTLKPRR